MGTEYCFDYLNYTKSEVVTTRDYLFAGGSQQDVVLKLCGVAAGDVSQRWVRIDNFCVDQLLKRANVFGVKFLKPLTRESERAEVILDRVEKSFSVLVSEDWVCWVVKVQHVVAAVNIVCDVPFTSGAECFDGVLLSFLHFGHVTIRYNWDALSCVNLVSLNAVTTEIAN